jgi:hypothetical protein
VLILTVSLLHSQVPGAHFDSALIITFSGPGAHFDSVLIIILPGPGAHFDSFVMIIFPILPQYFR